MPQGHVVDVCVVALYFVFMVGVGVWVARRKKANEMDSYLVSNRDVPLPRLAATMAATDLGGGFTMGMAGLGFTMGYAGSWLLFSSALGVLAAGALLVPRVWRFAQKYRPYTYPEFLGRRFDEKTRLVAAALASLAWWAFVGGQIIAGGKLVHVVLGLELTPAVLLIGAIVILYTVLGGLEAVIWTDYFQMIILVAGILFLALPLGLRAVGGVPVLRENLPAEMFSLGNIGPWQVVAWILSIAPIWFISMAAFQRIYAARDEATARRAFYITAFVEWPVYGMAGAVIGMMARVLYPQLEAELAMPAMVLHALPVGVAGLVVAAYMSAVMSTADSCLMVPVGCFVEDFYHRHIKRDASPRELVTVGRVAVVVLGVLAIYLAYRIPRIIDLVLYAYTFGASGLFFPTLAALFWKRATSAGAFLGILLGGLMGVGWSLAGSPYGVDPIFVGMPASLVGLVLGSLATQHGPEEDLETFYAVK